MTLAVPRAKWAAVALAAWCLFLGAHAVVTLGRNPGAMVAVRPLWTDSRVAAAATMAVLVALVAAWLGLARAAESRSWARWTHAAAGAAAIAAWWVATTTMEPWTTLIPFDASRLISAVALAWALAPIGARAPARLRARVRSLAPGWWAAAAAVAAIACTTARLEIAVTAAVNVAAWAFGAWLARRMRLEEAGTAVSAGLAWLLGWIALALLAFALGCARLWHPAVGAAVLALLAMVARRELVAGARRLFAPREPSPLEPPERLVVLASAVLLATALVASLAPEVYSDATGHHLALADRMAREGRLAFWPHWNATAHINHGAMLFAWGTLFSSPIAGKVQNFLFAAAVPLFLVAFGRRWLDRGSGLWAAGIWCSAGIVVWLSGTAYVDISAAAYALGAVAAYLTWLASDRPRTALAAGLLTGAILATKFGAYTFALPLGLMVLATDLARGRADGRRPLAATMAFGAGAALVFLPWIVRAWVLTGNPVFPLYNHVFRSPYWEPIQDLGGFDQMFGPPRAPAAWGVPWAMAFAPHRLVEVGGLGPLLLALVPLAAFARRWTRLHLHLALVTLLPTALWLAGIAYLRWFTLYLPLWALLAGALLSAVLAALPPRARVLAAAAPVALLAWTVAVDALTLSWWYHGESLPGLPWRVVLGRETADAYLRRNLVSYPAIAWLNANAPGERVLSPMYREHLYQDTLFEGHATAILPMRQKRNAILGAGHPDVAWRRFREAGYRYLLLEGGSIHVNGPRPMRAAVFREEFLARYMRLVLADQGVYLFRAADRPGPDPRWPGDATDAGNGRFEVRDGHGIPCAWSRDGAVAVDSSTVHGGEAALRLAAGATASLRMRTAGADAFVTTLFARGSGPATIAHLVLEWFTPEGGSAGAHHFGFWTGIDWDEYFFAATPPPGAARVRIAVRSEGTLWLDDVAFAPAPRIDPRDVMREFPAFAVYRAREGRFDIRYANRAHGFDESVPWGRPGDRPLMGDWDGDGIVTIGLFRPSEGAFHLRDRNTPGPADRVVTLGGPGDEPVAGDWDADGVTTVGVFRPAESTFHLLNAHAAGAPEVTVRCPSRGALPVAGDWNGDGRTTVGVYDPLRAEFTLCTLRGGIETRFEFGGLDHLPIAGDWDGDGTDTVGVYRLADGTLYARRSNTAGYGELSLPLGGPGDLPVPGSSPRGRCR